MNTVRRLYFYGLALISAEVVIWGLINLLRTVVDRSVGYSADTLATGLSLVLVGLPIFLLHWRVAQRDARRDPEERASRIRAVFLYAALFATLLPMVYALMAVLNRAFVQMAGLSTTRAWLGGEGTALDNLIALAINAAAFAFFWWILRADWQADTPENYLTETRRLYRYVWLLFSLTVAVAGIYNLLRYLFTFPVEQPDTLAVILSGAVTLLLVGGPLLAFFWWQIQSSLSNPAEHRSLLRLVVLYLISLAGVIGVISALGGVLTSLLRWVLGEPNTLAEFLRENSGEMAAAIPLGVMWWYFGQILTREVAAMPDQPRREALRRLYHYILSLLGLVTLYIGVIILLGAAARLVFEDGARFTALRDDFSGGISGPLVGLPLWLVTWRKMQREAARLDDTGDRARRSVLRKAYLYLVLFLLVIGAMGYTGRTLFILIDAALSGAPANLAAEVSHMLLSLIFDAALMVYHWRVLRQDGRVAQQTIGNLHAAYPTLVLIDGGETESGAFQQTFADALTQNLAKVAPRLPVAVHSAQQSAPDETMLGAKALMLPARLVLEPPEALRLWLSEYRGRRILIPVPEENWQWLGQTEKRPLDLGREAAQTLRQMAEGEAVRQSLPNSPWSIAGYILGGLFGLQLLFMLLVLLISSIFN